MFLILSDLLSLTQYLAWLSAKNTHCFAKERRCPHCGAVSLWQHGHYDRKADRSACGSLNPISIQRLFCPTCKKTCSLLPECIPPRRWYGWDIQQAALVLLLAGNSVRATATKITPSRHTLTRWFVRFKKQFLLHKDTLCHYFSELGRTLHFTDFWLTCLHKMCLSKAMRLCHAAGVSIP